MLMPYARALVPCSHPSAMLMPYVHAPPPYVLAHTPLVPCSCSCPSAMPTSQAVWLHSYRLGGGLVSLKSFHESYPTKVTPLPKTPNAPRQEAKILAHVLETS